MAKEHKSLLLSRKTKEVLYLLAMAEEPLEVNEIAKRLKRTNRQIYYDLDAINDMLDGIGELPVKRSGNMYSLSGAQKRRMIELIQNSIRITEKDNRIAYIICKVLYSNEKITIEVLQSELDFSRNSIISDLGQVKKILAGYNLSLENSKKSGYYVEGDICKKRYVFCYYLGIFLKSSSYNYMKIFSECELNGCVDKLRGIFTELHMYVKKRELFVLAYLLLCVRYFPGKEQEGALSDIEALKECALVRENFSEASKSEVFAYTLIILSRSIDKKAMVHDLDKETMQMAKQLIQLYEKKTGVILQNHQEILRTLCIHVELTSFCHRYDIPVINILTGELYKKQGALLEDISECIAAIEFPYPVYESEIASLAMLFLAHVPRKQFDSRLRVLLVCSSNDGLENYLKNEILSLSDKIDIMQVLNTTDSGTINGAGPADVIITTLNMEASYPTIKVSTIMTRDDKRRIFLFLLKFFQNRFDSEFD